MKLDKDYKKDVKREFAEADYIGMKIGIRIFLVILIISVLSIFAHFAYKEWRVEKERNIFKNSTTYTESAASFIADSYRQYNLTDDDAEKATIMEYVIMRYPNLDTKTIENETLRQFYNKCLTK